MDLSKYDELGEVNPSALKERYFELRERLRELLSAPVKDMAAVEAVVVELDELQAGLRDGQKRPEDTQRF